MNQILQTNIISVTSKNKTKSFFKYIFFLLLLLMMFFIFWFFYSIYNLNKQSEISDLLINNLDIERLYSNNLSYTTVKLDNNSFVSIIGVIEINKINIKYPILSELSNDLLKISPCKFYGPAPNTVGNLCIAGHNYDNNNFFSKLSKLTLGDTITISDFTGSVISYTIYDLYETTYSDTSCTSQNTNGHKEVTLVTCNNINGNRFIVKAKEKTT